MSDESLIGVDPLDWMNKKELDDCKKEISDESKQTDSPVIKLDSQFDIRAVSALNDKFKELIQLDKNTSINIDAADVSKLDAAAVQFLTAFKKSAEDKLINVKFNNASDYFLSSIELMGLQKTFEAKAS